MGVVVVREPWRLHPLAWIHRAEARAVAREMGATLVEYANELPEGSPLLRLSDPVMREVVNATRMPYRGPGREALERCYDKHEAGRIVTAAGFDVPRTVLADATSLPNAPFVLKPRRGSDSIGVRLAHAVPPSRRNAEHLVQERVIGEEVTIAVFRGEVGIPFRILVPPGDIYSFSAKYLSRPGRIALDDENLRERALAIAHTLGVDWAARVDFIIDGTTKRPIFLECDAAPLVGPASAFAASFSAAGVARSRQLEWLLSPGGDAERVAS